MALEEELKPLTGAPLFIGAIALSLCVFMQVLDYSIANVSIPYISGDLGVSNENGTWVITMFAVGNAIALPLTGWFTTRFGSTRVMVASTALFTFFSWLCGLSISINMIVTMRFIQGFVAGPLIPLSQSLLLTSFSKERRNLGLALWNMVAVVGPIAGPILGGWITFDYKWPWIFYINIPIGIICCIIIWILYKSRETPTKKLRVDWIGLALLAIGISALQILLDKGQQYDWWRSDTIRILTVVSIISLVFLVIWELTDKDPIIDFRLLKNRNFALGTLLTAVSYMTLFGAIVVSPLWLQTTMGYTALWAGLAVSTMGIAPFFTVLLVAKLMSKIRLKILVAISFLLYGASFFYFTRLDTTVSFEQVAMSRFYLGLGICTYLAPLTAISFAHFPASKLPMGQGIFHFFRIFLGGVGASTSVTLWQRRATHHHSNLVDTINPYNPVSKELFSKLDALNIRGQKALQVVDDMAWQQGFMLSLNDVFWVGMWCFVALFFIAFFFKKRKGLPSVSASH